MTSRLTAMIATQRRFVADASHQLRTPLTGLRLRLEAASAAWPRDRPSPDLDAATAEVDRRSQIVEELLDLSRAGEAATEPELCDLGAAAHAAAARFREPAQTRGVAVRVLDRGPAPGCCVEAELARVLDALLENALAYGAGGGDVEMTAAPGVIRVADRGPGPDPGDEELLFERFHRGRAARNGPPGTGLGLAISRALAQGWGGDVLLRAREGGGTVAVVTMPTHVAGPRPTEDSSRPVEVPA
jgi:signal transduction histidine kinase